MSTPQRTLLFSLPMVYSLLTRFLPITKYGYIAMQLEPPLLSTTLYFLYWSKITKKNKPHKTITRFNYEQIDKDMIKIDFLDVLSATEVSTAVSYFIDTLNNIITSYTSIIKTSNRKIIAKPWVTKGLLRCMRNCESDKLHQKTKRTRITKILQPHTNVTDFL